MKKLLVLAAALVLASCELIPEIEGPYPAEDLAKPRGNGEQVFDTPGEDRKNPPPAESPGSAEDRGDEAAEPAAEAAPGNTAETEPNSAGVVDFGESAPLFMEEQARETELHKTDLTEPDEEAAPDTAPEAFAETYYPEQAPDGEAAAIPADEPLVQLPPRAPVEEAPPVQQRPEPSAAVPAPPRTEPPVAAAPPQRENPPPVVPPVPPAAAVPVVPPEETSQEEIPPEPEREPYTPTIPDMPFQPETASPQLTESSLPYSRVVRAVVGQYIEIPFRGPGWVYLGEFGSRRGVRYDSRRMEPDGMTFVFRADAAGTYSLKFNRHDFVRDYILNDYVRVIVEEPPAATGSSWSQSQVGPNRVYASPRWPLATDLEGRGARPDASGAAAVPSREENDARGQTAPMPQTPAAQQAGAGAGSVPQAGTVTAPAAAPTDAPADPASVSAAADSAAISSEAVPQIEDWLKKAREEYDAGRIPGALEALDQFMIRFPGGSDEAFWLYGQSLEANNEGTRDIRLALDYYRRLTGEFPQSSRYDEARRRIAYLERFYFNIQ